MASIHKEIAIHASAENVWAVVRDIGAVHKRFVPGLVTDVRLEEEARVVTFANGMVVRELIVDIDDEGRLSIGRQEYLGWTPRQGSQGLSMNAEVVQ